MQTSRHLVLILLLFPLSGCLGPVSELYPEEKQLRPVPVYLVSHGWHIGIAFESGHLRDELPEDGRFPETQFLMVGWGDGKYFTADRVRVDLMLRAAFWPTGSVIHVVGFDRPVEEYFYNSSVVKVQLSEEGMEAMIDYLTRQFRTGPDGELLYAAPGLYQRSTFYEAEKWYFFPRTSNWWTAKVLRQSGFPITPFYAITSGNVLQQAGKRGEVIRE